MYSYNSINMRLFHLGEPEYTTTFVHIGRLGRFIGINANLNTFSVHGKSRCATAFDHLCSNRDHESAQACI